MNEVATTTTDTPAAPGALRKLPVIDPTWCEFNHEGQCWREVQVRLPPTATLLDLNETPTIWKLVQESQKALRQRDRVTIISWAEDWMVDGRVTDATKAVVQIAIIKRYDLTPRHDRLPQDDTYAVRWFGNGYAVERKLDQMCVSPIVATVQEAERHMSAKYSRAA